MIFVKFVKYNKVRTDTGSLVCDFTVLVLELDVWCAQCILSLLKAGMVHRVGMKHC